MIILQLNRGQTLFELTIMFSKMHSSEEKELDKPKELKLEPPKNNKLSNWTKKIIEKVNRLYHKN